MDSNHNSKLYIKIILSLSFLGSIFIYAKFLFFTRYGIEFTDESYYLVWISNPFIYNISITQFGYIYHPIYKILNGDIVLLRQFNVLLTLSLSWILSYLVLISSASSSREKKITNHVISAAISTSSLYLYSFISASPSYNSLALQGLLTTAIGLVLIKNADIKISSLGSFIIGTGGWLTFMAKPSTAAILSLIVITYLIVNLIFNKRIYLIIFFTTLFFLYLSAIYIDGSILKFLNRIHSGISLASTLQSGHNFKDIIKIDPINIDEKTINIIYLLFFSLSSLNILILNINKIKNHIKIFIYPIALIFIAITSHYIYNTQFNRETLKELIVIGICLSAIFTTLIQFNINILKSLEISHILNSAIFIFFPYAFSFGSNNNQWMLSGLAIIFCIIGSMIIFSAIAQNQSSWISLIPTCICIQLISLIIINIGWNFPYRQNFNIYQNDKVTNFGKNSEIILSKEYSEYIKNAVKEAKKSGFEPGTPIIDLTGQSPGILYALQAQSVGQAWMIGGYPGSLKRAAFSILEVDCKILSESWILFEENGPRSISETLLNKVGLDLSEGYTKSGSWQTAQGAGGYTQSRTQYLYSPLDSENNFKNCKKSKNNDKPR